MAAKTSPNEEREEEMKTLILLLVLQGVVFGGFCAWLAKQKNRDVGGWFFLGLLFSLVALIAIAVATPLKPRTDFREEDQKQQRSGW